MEGLDEKKGYRKNGEQKGRRIGLKSNWRGSWDTIQTTVVELSSS